MIRVLVVMLGAVLALPNTCTTTIYTIERALYYSDAQHLLNKEEGFMAIFNPIYELTLRLEGGYKLHQNATESAVTYAGIYRKAHPHWKGWKFIDAKDMDNPELTNAVIRFYKEQFWNKIRGDEIEDQEIAKHLFEFAVNAGVPTAVKLLQLCVGETPDGVVGKDTLKAINSSNPTEVVYCFTLAKIKRYNELANKDPNKYGLYLRGWLNRAFAILEAS